MLSTTTRRRCSLTGGALGIGHLAVQLEVPLFGPDGGVFQGQALVNLEYREMLGLATVVRAAIKSLC